MNRKLVLVMVGLPARGKSYIVKMLIRYLSWIGFPTKVFNIGDYRRRLGYGGVDKSFFEKDNSEGMRIREKMVEVVQDEMYHWLQADDEAKVAIFDATNTTKARRRALTQRAAEEKNTLLNYKLKLQNDDYKNQDPLQALADFKDRVRAYEMVYETIEDSEDGSHIQYIKLYNVGQKVVTRNCKGYLPSQVAFYLQNIHIGPRKIWLTRHAESVSHVIGEIGEDTGELTEGGRLYSMTLAKFIKMEQENIHIAGPGREILVLAGTQTVDSESIAHLQMLYPVATTPLLNELRGGSFTGMTRAEFRAQYPDIHAQREADKLDFRFPGEGGESYMDVIQRVRPIIVELERQPRSLVVVCHLAVQRCLYAYFMGIPIKDVPHIELPQHCVAELVPTPFGTNARHITEAEMQDCY
ncbi:6-phosphofructo-2-kinase-domain-containing protein [Tribonema minus]|uniref:6-phosphofructo-2-kinase-domain-containing protein n=1 Tax=Tribonema minus TaxID=303371 RepID=A0A835Z3Y2_9STRA|nr:6-phosphofructo-2-kinase-domain-containing protein [Tribonema minus]